MKGSLMIKTESLHVVEVLLEKSLRDMALLINSETVKRTKTEPLIESSIKDTKEALEEVRKELYTRYLEWKC